MPKHVFYSFHYDNDCVRTSQVRNIGVVQGNQPAKDNDWETIKKGGDKSIQQWIDGQLSGRDCSIVLIGEFTAGRKWINYEIEQSWNSKKGLLGIHIHHLKNFQGLQSKKGANPFDGFNMKNDGSKLSNHVKVYDPPYFDSKQVYGYIADNLESWINTAISMRKSYG